MKCAQTHSRLRFAVLFHKEIVTPPLPERTPESFIFPTEKGAVYSTVYSLQKNCASTFVKDIFLLKYLTTTPSVCQLSPSSRDREWAHHLNGQAAPNPDPSWKVHGAEARLALYSPYMLHCMLEVNFVNI